MSEETMQTTNKSTIKGADGEVTEPVHVVRNGAIAASIWRRQSPSGFAYYDFSLSRSWKSMSSQKTGYSRNYFPSNQENLVDVIRKATVWIAERQTIEPPGNTDSLAA